MAILTTAASIGAAFVALGGYYVRHRVSRDWITPAALTQSASVVPIANLSPDDVCVVTGGNVGLGYETAKNLASRGASVVLACRETAGGREIARSISASGGGEVECMQLDLGSLASVRRFVDDLDAKYPKGIKLLICNAGVWIPMDQKQMTSDGYEVHFGVNHLGHFLLAKSVALERKMMAEGGRVIFVSSGLSKNGKLDLESRDFVHEGRRTEPKKKPSFAPAGYCDSKLMNVLTCRELDARLKESGNDRVVSAYAVSPGWCQSSLGRHVAAAMPWYKKLAFAPVMLLVRRTAVQGAQNILFVSVAEKDLDGKGLVGGAMYRDGRVAEVETRHADGFDPEAREGLWKLSEELVEDQRAKSSAA